LIETFGVIYQRRSVKQYNNQHKLLPVEEAKLLEPAIQALTSLNKQH
jgi:hypothetical protein